MAEVPVTGGGAGFAWPAGYQAAASLTFDVDAESAVLSADPAAASRASLMSHQAYGPQAGVPRLLDILERHQLRGTFFVPGYTARRHPGTVRSIVAAGHEVGHHGYLHEPLTGVDEKTETGYLDRGLAALAEVAGVTPAGYRAPMWELNYRSPALLAARGFRYDSSLMDADAPYLIACSEGPAPPTLIELPIHWGLDDWEQYAYLPGVSGSGLIESPAKALEMWALELEAMHACGGHFVLTAHPFLSGRPGRAAMLERLIERMRELDGLWIAGLEEVASHAESLDLPARRLAPPELPQA
jgi:peptidoglycan/xylan/chitin deacetylase (PgdA/CDA1 family)